jgi:putative ABC transport system ATP-binding protein
MDMLKEVHRNNTTICLVTHDLDFAALAERTIHLVDGHVVVTP